MYMSSELYIVHELYAKNKTVSANYYKCADPVVIYAVSVTLYPILKICNLNLLNITHYHLSVE